MTRADLLESIRAIPEVFEASLKAEVSSKDVIVVLLKQTLRSEEMTSLKLQLERIIELTGAKVIVRDHRTDVAVERGVDVQA